MELIELARHPSIDDWLDNVRRRKATTRTHLDRAQIVADRDADRR